MPIWKAGWKYSRISRQEPGFVGAAAVALVDDDQVEKVGRIFLVEAGPAFVPGQGLVDGEVELAAFVDDSVFNLEAGVAEGGEGLGHWGRRSGRCGRRGRGFWAGGISPVRFQRDRHSFQAMLKATAVLPVPGGHG